jgi:hypothetical protein
MVNEGSQCHVGKRVLLGSSAPTPAAGFDPGASVGVRVCKDLFEPMRLSLRACLVGEYGVMKDDKILTAMSHRRVPISLKSSALSLVWPFLIATALID